MKSIVFGPVRSRRLGLSLGVDLLTLKTCSFDCLYCEIGPTTNKTTERQAYRPTEEVKKALREKLSDPELHFEVLTFAGSGEPTLHKDLGELIRLAKDLTDRPICVLTNASLVWQEEVLRDLCLADLVLPSLDAAKQETFERLNRPAPGLSISAIIEGLKKLREQMSGQMWLEIMLVGGINDREEDLAALREAVKEIRPHRIQLNTVVRPPAYPEASPLSFEKLEEIAKTFEPEAEIILPKPGEKREKRPVSTEEILALLSRRPCPSEEIAAALGFDYKETLLALQQLISKGLVHSKVHDQRVFYYV